MTLRLTHEVLHLGLIDPLRIAARTIIRTRPW